MNGIKTVSETNRKRIRNKSEKESETESENREKRIREREYRKDRGKGKDMEEFFSGFCKTQNQTRMVMCEFEMRDGKKIFLESDCAFGTCPYSSTCVLMGEALKNTNFSDTDSCPENRNEV